MAVERLAELIRERQPCVVLTGAGVSTDSGIPDFRSPTGIWARYDPMEYASIEAFQADPVKVWDFYARRLDVLARAEPNAAHHALARLEGAGWVFKLHMVLGMTLFLVFQFTRLVHVWSGFGTLAYVFRA